MCVRAQTNVATFECSFVFVTFISRFFATKHSLILNHARKCLFNVTKVKKLTIKNGYIYLIYNNLVFQPIKDKQVDILISKNQALTNIIP